MGLNNVCLPATISARMVCSRFKSRLDMVVEEAECVCVCVSVCVGGGASVCVCVCLCVSMCVCVPRSFQKLPDRTRVFIILFRSPLSLPQWLSSASILALSTARFVVLPPPPAPLSPPHPRLAWHDVGAWISSPMKSLIVPLRASLSLSLSLSS